MGSGDIEEIRSMIPTGCRMLVFDKAENGTSKGPPCAGAMPVNTNCTAVPNLGREFHTYISYVVAHYDSLPDWVVFFPGVLHRHDRAAHLQQMIGSTLLSDAPRDAHAFWCVRRMRACEGFFDKPRQNVSQYHGFEMDNYNSMAPDPMTYDNTGELIRMAVGATRGAVASVLGEPADGVGVAGGVSLPLETLVNGSVNGSEAGSVLSAEGPLPWAAGIDLALVAEASRRACSQSCVTGVCHYGLITTTRENLRSQPLAVYQNLLRELPFHNPEAGFVYEVIAEMIFAYAVAQAKPLPSPSTCSAQCELSCPNDAPPFGPYKCRPDPQGADPNGPEYEKWWTSDDRYHNVEPVDLTGVVDPSVAQSRS